MSNKTKGWLMLVPVLVILIYDILFIWGWWSILVIAWFSFVCWWVSKAIDLIKNSNE